MNIKKVALGILTFACAPIAVAISGEIVATLGAVAVVCGGVSEAIVIDSGLVVMGMAEKTTKFLGGKMIEEAMIEE